VTWRANGDYYSFREDMIRVHTPAASGVYGLYNFRHQILIGNSANIQHALLRHLGDTKFRFRRFVPTGFVFELCAPELRESRTQELIREYDPILQASRPFTALWHSWMTRNAMAFCPSSAAVKSPASDRGKKDATDSEKKKSKRFRLGREQLAMAATGFSAMLLVMGVIMLPARLKDEPGTAWQVASIEKSLTSDPVEERQAASLTTPGIRDFRDSLPRQSKASESDSETKSRHPAETVGQPREPQIFIASEQAPDDDFARAESKSALPKAKQQRPQRPVLAKKEQRENAWAVQAMATPDRRIAIDWLEKLKARGYDAFLIDAEIKGQTWYRVRAGSFSTRQEAEALRKILQSKEGFGDAFVAGSTKSETLTALNPR
jgi:cell division septation protein DedD